MILSLAAALTIAASCQWTDRGRDPYMGELPAAVDNYTQIPQVTREALKAKMRARKYDDQAHISATAIRSDKWNYGPLEMMHFGNGRKLCATVLTTRWPENDKGERALIYTVGEWSVAVPSICRNVSLIRRGPAIPPPPFIPLVEVAEPEPYVAQVYQLAAPVPVDVPFTALATPTGGQALPQAAAPAPEEPTYLTMWSRPLFGPLPIYMPVPVPVGGVPVPAGGVPVAPIPEPSTYALMALGLAWVAWSVRRRMQ